MAARSAPTVRKRAAPTTASLRLKQDYMRLMKDPVPYIIAAPKMDNILEWFVLNSHICIQSCLLMLILLSLSNHKVFC